MNPVDRNEILQMLAEGRITASEAINLLDQKPMAVKESPAVDPVEELKAGERDASTAEDELTIEEIKGGSQSTDPFKGIKITEDDILSRGKGERPRWLKIRVGELDSGRNKVNITLPIGLVNFGLGIARRFGAEFDEEYSAGDLWQMVKEGERGVLVDVEDEEDNERVQIYLD